MRSTVDVPTKWSQVTLRQFMALTELHTEESEDSQERAFVTISIMTGTDPDDIRKWSMDTFNKVWSTLNFLTVPPDKSKRTTKFKVGGKWYRVVSEPKRMSYGAWTDLMSHCKSEKDTKANLHKCFAACLEQRGRWPWSGYAYELIDPELILDLPVSLVVPNTAFFLSEFLKYSKNMLAYLEKSRKMAQRKAAFIKRTAGSK